MKAKPRVRKDPVENRVQRLNAHGAVSVGLGRMHV